MKLEILGPRCPQGAFPNHVTNEKRGQATPTTYGWDKHALKMKETKVPPLKEAEEVAYLIRKSNMARKQKRKLYPKVKVRTDGQGDQPAHSWSSLLSLKDIQFLCLQDPCFPVKGHQDDSPPPIARIPKSYVPSVIMPKVSVSEGTEKKNIFNEEDKPNIRASSIPRPRAVLSSPDNDAVIGNNNKTRVARPSALKNNKVIQNRHEQCKVVPCRITDASPTNTRKSKSTPGNKSEVKVKKGLPMDKPRCLRI
uniref:Uncharacterized protein n=1 Tax=Populus alba TaxID=43335 RepID=A0A4U5NK75_POPAL|nr:uncharacterized protein D5086_0000266080 [Populus alba]